MRPDYYHGIMKKLDKCPFCDLKDKYIVSEKDGMVLTMNLFPYAEYHLMIISRRHIEAEADLSKEEWQALYEMSQLGRKLQKEVGVENVHLVYREGSDAGKNLGHWHAHLMPFDKECYKYEIRKDQKIDPLEAAEKLRSLIKN